MNKKFKKHLNFNSYFFLLFSIEIIALYFFLTERNFNIDEFESIHSGWLISNGQTIYEDFIQQKHPLLYYLLAIVVYWFGNTIDTILVSSYLMLIFSIGIVIYTYKIANILFDKNTACITLLILPILPWFVQSGYEIRPDVPMLFLCLASIYYFYSFIEKARLTYLIYSAAMISLGFFFLQKVIFWSLPFLLIVTYAWLNKNINKKDLFLFILTVFIMCISFLFLLSLNVNLSEYFFYSFEFVKARQENLAGPLNTEKIIYEISQKKSYSWFLLFLFLLTLYLVKFSYKQKIIAISGVWLISTVLFVTDPGARYFLPAMPFIAIVISYGGANLYRYNSNCFYLVGTIIFLIFILNIKNMINANNLPGKNDPRNKQLERVQYVIDNTSVDDYVYDGIARFNLFRKDLDFVWLGGDRYTHQSSILSKLIPYKYNIYDLIKEKKPKIISYYFIDLTKYDWLLENYQKSLDFEDVYIKYTNNTGYKYWDAFVDELNIGSTIYPEQIFFTSNGDIEVNMQKAKESKSSENKELFYPYVGIRMKFNPDEKSIDLNHTKQLFLTYRLSGKLSILLSQEGIEAGEEFRLELPEMQDYQDITLQLESFKQPTWVREKQDLDLSNITGLKFQIISSEQATADLGIRKIKFIN